MISRGKVQYAQKFTISLSWHPPIKSLQHVFTADTFVTTTHQRGGRFPLVYCNLHKKKKKKKKKKKNAFGGFLVNLWPPEATDL